MTQNVLVWLIAESASIIFAIGAVVLAYNGIDGWGWMLVASLLTCVTGTASTKNKEE